MGFSLCGFAHQRDKVALSSSLGPWTAARIPTAEIDGESLHALCFMKKDDGSLRKNRKT